MIETPDLNQGDQIVIQNIKGEIFIGFFIRWEDSMIILDGCIKYMFLNRETWNCFNVAQGLFAYKKTTHELFLGPIEFNRVGNISEIAKLNSIAITKYRDLCDNLSRNFKEKLKRIENS